jgi:hypothetical protein
MRKKVFMLFKNSSVISLWLTAAELLPCYPIRKDSRMGWNGYKITYYRGIGARIFSVINSGPELPPKR